MFTRLRLENFKSFREADLQLGPLTVLVGTDASGKSNLRDAFRFLHAAGRGYSVPEVLGGRYAEGGYQEWSGIRGGTREVAYRNSRQFLIETELSASAKPKHPALRHVIQAKRDGNQWNYSRERLWFLEPLHLYMDCRADTSGKLHASFNLGGHDQWAIFPLTSLGVVADQPFHGSLEPTHISDANVLSEAQQATSDLVLHYQSIRFAEFLSNSLLTPSTPGQVILGEQGENLPSILQEIGKTKVQKELVLGWLEQLTPYEVKDYAFLEGADGKLQLKIIERSGARISAMSASDGTLRFLGLLALVFGPKPPEFVFIEEIETGLHPTRLHLLVQLLEIIAEEGKTQIVATTHAPLVLHHLSEQSFEHAAVTYRLPDEAETRITRIVDIPDARRVFHEHDPAELHASGWLETAVYMHSDPDPVTTEPQAVGAAP